MSKRKLSIAKSKFLSFILFLKWGVFGLLYSFFCLIFSRKLLLILTTNRSDSYGNLQQVIKLLSIGRGDFYNYEYKVLSVSSGFLKTLFFLARAKVILVDQSNEFIANLKLNEETIVIQCWHGGGLLKKIVYDDHSNKSVESKGRLSRVYRNIDYVVVSDSRFIKIFSGAFNISCKQVLPFGLPRVDRLFFQNILKNRFLISKLLQIKCDSKVKIVLYAPTFREVGRKRVTPVPDAVPSDTKGYIFLFRAHPSITCYTLPNGWLDASNISQEILLSSVDILLSDYSSIVFDFSFFKRPIALMVNDYKNCYERDRGLYVDLTEITYESQLFLDWKNFYKFLNNRSMRYYDIWSKNMSACDGKSAERLIDFIHSCMS